MKLSYNPGQRSWGKLDFLLVDHAKITPSILPPNVKFMCHDGNLTINNGLVRKRDISREEDMPSIVLCTKDCRPDPSCPKAG